jgi:hypothetical protein
MATSPIYGWLEPDNTDLVKNGALSIRTLGNAIDTTMGTMTPKSTFTAKGSIAAATAASTPANLSVGANDTMLVADSTAATGLAYKSASTLYPWQAWTPTYSNVTVGNGSIVARYQQIGKLVTVFFKLNIGTTTSVSNYGTIALPVQASQSQYMTGVASFVDNGASIYGGWAYIESGGNSFYFVANLTNGAYATFAPANTTGTPTTFGNTDSWFAAFTYEAA